jgi:murein DD-endopeptidase MepM/ murein hydrolase activator NlpD
VALHNRGDTAEDSESWATLTIDTQETFEHHVEEPESVGDISGLLKKLTVIIAVLLLLGSCTGSVFVGSIGAYMIVLPRTNPNLNPALKAQPNNLGGLLPGEQLPISGGGFSCPVDKPVITMGFGPSNFYLVPIINGVRFHTGMDMAKPEGSPVQAVMSGVVTTAGPQLNSLGSLVGYGNLIVISSIDGRQEYYGHLQQIYINSGQLVRRGQPIGAVGSTGNANGPHLHFEVRQAGKPINPMEVLPPTC